MTVNKHRIPARVQIPTYYYIRGEFIHLKSQQRVRGGCSQVRMSCVIRILSRTSPSHKNGCFGDYVPSDFNVAHVPNDGGYVQGHRWITHLAQK